MLLHLETAGAVCSAALSLGGNLVAYRESAEPRAHAALLTVFIDELLTQAGIDAMGIDAVSLSAGPGSYTGLRIASSVAKGFCYAAGKPLIALNTLQLMASGFMQDNEIAGNYLICPMIDARRDEVFSAVYNTDLSIVKAPAPELLTGESYAEMLAKQTVYFIGDGAAKFSVMLGTKPNANFNPGFYLKAKHQAALATQKFENQQFEDVAYFEPDYLKEFYTTAVVKK
ncbi:MAG: tRNA (adenosine(37)-N6)-threonylcarbamoyltransferase complex dimerization subunit type 1 TsaB [Sphingobacteriales bacterium JAD_PAG50586_3]|nr:MAG: tRNA (adenosine(37)-N6)-threonylcarbamoyltransferase complex dimerization subunit type 1 TsaB [Sphingobacteriales bacterium JAD_PAG50586_3]